MNAIEYLEAAKIEEVASQYRERGYEVKVSPTELRSAYDLVATRGDQRIAIEVKARSNLRENAAQIKRLREQALEQGFDEFRLVVVNPPREVSVEIEGLGRLILEYLLNNVPQNLDQLSSRTLISGVNNVEIRSIEVTAEGIRVVADGTVDVELDASTEQELDGLGWSTDFPISFDLGLDHQLRISRVNELEVDTSSFYE
jgi:hypothetical protein